MTAAAPVTSTGELLGLLDGVVYGDAFACAVTREEAWRYSRASLPREAFDSLLSSDDAVGAVVELRDGLVCLSGRAELLDRRGARIERAHVLQRRARRVARVLRHAPFVRALVLTGSAAADDAGADADVDLLVVVAAGRVAMVFALLGAASRLVGRQRFCPNYYLAEDRLAVEPRDLFVAHELGQARALVGSLRALQAANAWLDDVLPNASAPRPTDAPLRAGGVLQRLLELPLRGRLGEALETRARALAAARLRAHHAKFEETVPDDVLDGLHDEAALRFHSRAVHAGALEAYESAREELRRRLEGR